jgi:hypothetical protein
MADFAFNAKCLQVLEVLEMYWKKNHTGNTGKVLEFEWQYWKKLYKM